jgi:HlyD family secretion protein
LRRLAWLVFSLVLVSAGLSVAWYGFGQPGAAAMSLSSFDHEEEEGAKPGSISVNTVRPVRKTLQRVLTQPGTVRPEAQAELYAKTSGYLKSIQRDPTPQTAAALAGQLPVAGLGGGPLGRMASVAAAAQVEFLRAPQKDLGSRVRVGEPLVEIDSPERLQEVAERESVLEQRLAELEQARTMVGTAEASVESVKAQKAQADAEVRRADAEHTFRLAELGRLRELARSRTITAEVVDEKQFQVNAAAASMDSSRAKVLAAQTDLAVYTSKLATAKADLRVKETLVRVARDAVTQARIQASYAVLVAPFDGVITHRGIDEGDFVQNSTSGQTRTLMTISAIDRVKVVLQARERDAVWVDLGAEATLDIDARTGWQVRGRVARTANVLDPQSRTLHVEIDLDNPNRKLLPGMYGTVTLTLQRIPDAMALPATAVYSRGGSNYVLEVRDGVARRVPVVLRFDDGKEVEVVKLLDGSEAPLDGSEELIVSNKGEIADGQRVSTRPLSGAN